MYINDCRTGWKKINISWDQVSVLCWDRPRLAPATTRSCPGQCHQPQSQCSASVGRETPIRGCKVAYWVTAVTAWSASHHTAQKHAEIQLTEMQDKLKIFFPPLVFLPFILCNTDCQMWGGKLWYPNTSPKGWVLTVCVKGDPWSKTELAAPSNLGSKSKAAMLLIRLNTGGSPSCTPSAQLV